mmetsp:Transcript_50447/g.98684  ORF Transcript_50447/g.98684 Transcript_50447/m.98684 type:complete len:252 (-) Transcript_50447:272-1027(-)
MEGGQKGGHFAVAVDLFGHNFRPVRLLEIEICRDNIGHPHQSHDPARGRLLSPYFARARPYTPPEDRREGRPHAHTEGPGRHKFRAGGRPFLARSRVGNVPSVDGARPPETVEEPAGHGHVEAVVGQGERVQHVPGQGAPAREEDGGFVGAVRPPAVQHRGEEGGGGRRADEQPREGRVTAEGGSVLSAGGSHYVVVDHVEEGAEQIEVAGDPVVAPHGRVAVLIVGVLRFQKEAGGHGESWDDWRGGTLR